MQHDICPEPSVMYPAMASDAERDAVLGDHAQFAVHGELVDVMDVQVARRTAMPAGVAVPIQNSKTPLPVRSARSFYPTVVDARCRRAVTRTEAKLSAVQGFAARLTGSMIPSIVVSAKVDLWPVAPVAPSTPSTTATTRTLHRIVRSHTGNYTLIVKRWEQFTGQTATLDTHAMAAD